MFSPETQIDSVEIPPQNGTSPFYPFLIIIGDTSSFMEKLFHCHASFPGCTFDCALHLLGKSPRLSLARCAWPGPTWLPPPWAQQSLEKMMSQMKRRSFCGKEGSFNLSLFHRFEYIKLGDIQKHSKATVPCLLAIWWQKMLRCTVWGTIFQQRINSTCWLLVALSIFVVDEYI